MQRGSAGSRVAELQARLAKILGENSTVRITGVYDGQTQNAVQSMQLAQNAWARDTGEQSTRNDGLVDAETWEFLTSRTGRVYVPRVRLNGLGAADAVMLDSRNATWTCRSGEKVPVYGSCPEDSARVGLTQTAMLPSGNTRFYIGLAAGAAAVLLILWVK
ncbi:MAG: peptidoglycan-binding domain-containing protein [Gemmatimonadaceae bacterium]